MLTSWKNKTSKKEYLKSLVADKSLVPANYDMKLDHNLGEYISHVKFGVGFIQRIIESTKIEVFFEGSERVLLQNWQKK